MQLMQMSTTCIHVNDALGETGDENLFLSFCDIVSSYTVCQIKQETVRIMHRYYPMFQDQKIGAL